MNHAQKNNVGHENAIPRAEHIAASAIAQFYTFASRCMDWAKTTRSLQERVVYVQMGLQWLAAGARLQTFLQIKNSGGARTGAAKEVRASEALTPDPCSPYQSQRLTRPDADGLGVRPGKSEE